MSLEATTNAIEDHLIDALSFRLQPGASYVTNRRSVSFPPKVLIFISPFRGRRLLRLT